MITALKTPAPYSFAGNPVAFEFQTDFNTLVSISVLVAGEYFYLSAYPAKVSDNVWKFSFDISDFLKTHVKLQYDATLVSQVNLASFMAEYSVLMADYSFTGKVVIGGISKEFQKYLLKQTTNAFTFRFLNPFSQFLFTTRTDTDYIRLTRNELSPVFFITPTAGSISVETDKGDRLLLATNAIGIPCMVNLPLLLNSFSASGVVSELFFCIDGIRIFKIIIADPGFEESYLLKFKNSLDVYEYLEVSGKASRTPEFKNDDTFNVFDPEVQDFRESRLRVPSTNVVDVETGYKSHADLLFIGDLLSSTQVWLVDQTYERECLVSSANYSHALRQTQPESISLKIEFADAEIYFTPFSPNKVPDTFLVTDIDEFLISDNNELISI